jgi:hypothetical protein
MMGWFGKKAPQPTEPADLVDMSEIRTDPAMVDLVNQAKRVGGLELVGDVMVSNMAVAAFNAGPMTEDQSIALLTGAVRAIARAAAWMAAATGRDIAAAVMPRIHEIFAEQAEAQAAYRARHPRR